MIRNEGSLLRAKNEDMMPVVAWFFGAFILAVVVLVGAGRASMIAAASDDEEDVKRPLGSRWRLLWSDAAGALKPLSLRVRIALLSVLAAVRIVSRERVRAVRRDLAVHVAQRRNLKKSGVRVPASPATGLATAGLSTFTSNVTWDEFTEATALSDSDHDSFDMLAQRFDSLYGAVSGSRDSA